MEKTAIDQPSVFFGICARLLPAEKRGSPSRQVCLGALIQVIGSLLREVIEAVRAGIPDTADTRPREVFDRVLSALRQADAKLLDSPESTPKTNSAICPGEIRE